MSIDDFRDEFESDFEFPDEEEWQDESTSDKILGMAPAQRFVVSLLLFFTVAIISAFCLVVTGKIALPL